MIHEIREKKLSNKIRDLAFSRLFFPVFLLVVVVLSIPVISVLNSGRFDLRQRASQGTPTATVNINPSVGTLQIGQQFTVSLQISGGGQTFNAAQADVSVSPNMTVTAVSIIPQASGGCNFVFVNNNKTPKASDPSFAGAILSGSLTQCTLYTMTLTANASGVGSINLARVSVKSYTLHQDILLSFQNGSYTIQAVVTPTNTPTPTASPTPLPTNVPTLTPTPTPLPSSTPTPTLTPAPRQGDINGDGIIDLTDLSIFGSDWEKTTGFNNPNSDIDHDGVVDLTDFSILAAAYGT